jgi:ABC-type multidrug transport system ATPase subunit
MDHAIWAEGLVRRFGETTALDGVDLAVRAGTVHGLLGPNGAGKTTTVRVLATLIKPDAGHATVGGYDVVRQAHSVRQFIGLTGQYASVDEAMTGTENLLLIGRLFGTSRRQARLRARELLVQFRLDDAAERPVRTYSGGMRRRLDLAASLVARPRLLYLDEPTTGLDPRSRTELWELVRGLVGDGTTVMLTTQYLDEADQLADEIAVIDHGRVSVLVGILAPEPEKVSLLSFTVLFPLSFLSNVFVPLNTMPGWLQAVVKANPVTILSDAARGLLVGGPVAGPATWSLILAAGLIAVFAPLSLRALNRRV